MNQNAKEEIDNLLTSYLSMLADAQVDVNTGYGLGTVDYMKAIERHKLLTESVSTGVDALSQIVYAGNGLKEEK